MNTKWEPWLIAGLVVFILGGFAGDLQFDPQKMNFSFVVFSLYGSALVLVIAALAKGLD